MLQVASADNNSTEAAPAAALVATVVAPSNRNMLNVEANYVSHANDKWKLIIMTIGLETEIDVDSSSWNSIPRCEIKPRKKDFQDKVKRCGIMSLPPPCPNNWDINQCITWLKENPVSGDDELRFLQQKSECVCRALRCMETEAAMNNKLTCTG